MNDEPSDVSRYWVLHKWQMMRPCTDCWESNWSQLAKPYQTCRDIYIYTKSSRRSVPSIGISEAKLIWGVWGGEVLIRARLGRWGRSLAGESSKNELPPPPFFKRAPVWTVLVVFWRFSLGVKSQNTVIYSVFGLLAWKKSFLQHAENCVNTTVFARCRPQNTVNTVVFATRSKKHRKCRGFGLARR